MNVKYKGLRIELIRRDMNQRELAEKLGVHYNTVSNWLRGTHQPDLPSVIDAMFAMGMTRDEILEMRLGDLITLEENGQKEKAPA